MLYRHPGPAEALVEAEGLDLARRRVIRRQPQAGAQDGAAAWADTGGILQTPVGGIAANDGDDDGDDDDDDHHYHLMIRSRAANANIRASK